MSDRLRDGFEAIWYSPTFRLAVAVVWLVVWWSR